MSRQRQGIEVTALATRDRLGAGARRVAFVIAAALLLGCGGGDSGVAIGQQWVVLGSSTAAGVGASPGRSWAARLDGELRSRDARLDNRARSGATTYEALPAAAPRPAGRPVTDPAQDIARVMESNPRVVILAFPSNDAMRGYTAEESVANLLSVREFARRRGAGVIVLSSQPRDDADVQAHAAMIVADAALATELGACFVAVRAELADAQGRIAAGYGAGDGVHLNDAGHGLIFARLWSAVSSGRCVSPP